MITAAKCSAGMAGSYYRKDDYYAREKNGEWHGKYSKELGDFKTEKFNEIIRVTERYRNFEIVFQVSRDLTDTYFSQSDFKSTIDDVVQKIAGVLDSDESIKVKFFRTRKNKEKFKVRLETDAKSKHLKIVLSSHKVLVRNCDSVLKKLSDSNIPDQFKSELEKRFKDLGIDYYPGKFNAFIYEKSGNIGDDFTFSVPKSLSIEMCQNERSFQDILESQKKAVSETLNFMESNYVFARVFEDKKLTLEKTSNFLSARFDHFTSREKDPQLHTHCIIFNQTWCEDNKLRSIDNIHLYKHKYLFDRLYMSILSRELQKKGFEIKYTDKEKGNFEIAGYKRETIQHYSTRFQRIENYIIEKNLNRNDFHEREKAILNTRPKSESIDFEIWKSSIKKELESMNVPPAREKNFQVFKELSPIEKEALLTEAKEIIEEKNAAFTKEHFLAEALARGEGKVSIDDAEKFFKFSGYFRKVGEESILNLTTRYYTTENNIQVEKSIFKSVEDGKRKWNGLNEKKVLSKLFDTPLNTNQMAAASFMLSSSDRVIAVQGDAGVGKTFTLNHVREIFEENGYQVFMVAPSNKAVEALREEAGANEASTIHNFLNRMERVAGNETPVTDGQIQNNWNFDGLVPGKGKEVIVMDEASMVDNRLMSSVMEVSDKRKAKLILIGDSKQLLPVAQGKSFCNLVNDKKIDFVEMNKALRQSLASPEIKKSVNLAARGFIGASINNLDDYTVEISARSLRLNQIAKDFVALAPHERNVSCVITALHADRHELNHSIREFLKMKGELSAGRFITTNNGRGKEERNEFSIGDRIVFLKTDTLFGEKVSKGDIGTISKMQGNRMFCTVGNRTISFSTINYNHFDYAYSITVYRSQGASIKNVFLNIDTAQNSMNHKNGYYVMISRTKQGLRLYTNDKDELFDAVKKAQNKLSIWNFQKNNLLSLFRPKDFDKLKRGVQKKLLLVESYLNRAYKRLYEAEINREMALKVLEKGKWDHHESLMQSSLKCDLKVVALISKAEVIIDKVGKKNQSATEYLGIKVNEIKGISGNFSNDLETIAANFNRVISPKNNPNLRLNLK